MKRLNTLLKQAGVVTPVIKQTEMLQLLKESPITTDGASAIAIIINSEEEITKTRNEVARAIKALPQWDFGTKLDKATLTLYVGKFEKQPKKEEIEQNDGIFTGEGVLDKNEQLELSKEALKKGYKVELSSDTAEIDALQKIINGLKDAIELTPELKSHLDGMLQDNIDKMADLKSKVFISLSMK
jgi:hypothetical protein